MSQKKLICRLCDKPSTVSTLGVINHWRCIKKAHSIEDAALRKLANKKEFGGRPNLMSLRRAQNKAYDTLFNLN